MLKFRCIALVAMIGLFAIWAANAQARGPGGGHGGGGDGGGGDGGGGDGSFHSGGAGMVEDLDPVGSDRHPRAEAFTVAPR